MPFETSNPVPRTTTRVPDFASPLDGDTEMFGVPDNFTVVVVSTTVEATMVVVGETEIAAVVVGTTALESGASDVGVTLFDCTTVEAVVSDTCSGIVVVVGSAIDVE